MAKLRIHARVATLKCSGALNQTALKMCCSLKKANAAHGLNTGNVPL